MTVRRGSGEALPPISEYDSKPHLLRPTLRNHTLRRCWGALKETVDALGAIWDAYDKEDEDTEANVSCHSGAESLSTPLPPMRPSLDIFKTPPSRPLHESTKSPRSHYETLANSPTTSRSARRKRKTNPWRPNPTPARSRNQKGDIDHSYSTDEDGRVPHARLLERLFYQGPPQVHDDKVCVFVYPQGVLMENNKPNDRNGKKRLVCEQPAKSLGQQVSALPDEMDGASLEQLRSDRSLSDDLRLEREVSISLNIHATRETIGSEPEDHHDEMDRTNSRDTTAHHEGTAPNIASPNATAVPLRQLSKRAASKIPTATYNMEAWSGQVALQGDLPNQGMLDGTLPTEPHSDIESQSTKSQSGEDDRAQEQEEIDTWRGQITPQTTIRNETLLDGKRLREPHFETRSRRWQRRAASCIILSAAVPTERDTTGLLTTPLGPWWGPTEEAEPSGMAILGSEETLMTLFGVSCDLGVAGSHHETTLSSADDVMSRSAAMGSMSKLNCSDTEAKRLAEATSLVRLAYADDKNQWWHCVNNARGDPDFLYWTAMLDMCELPPDFQDEETKAPVNRCRDLGRVIYDFYSLHHREGSNMNIPQRSSIHNYYMHKLEQHTGSVWKTFMLRWVPNIKTFPPANPVAAAAEAYIQVNIKYHPRSGSMFRRRESPVNALSKYVTFMPKHAWRQKEDRLRFVLDNGLMCFAQLVFVRCQALRFETYLVKHPEVLVPAQLP